MTDETVPQTVTVTQAERWMDRPIKVELSMQLTEKFNSSQTFYVSGDEALELSRQLDAYVKGAGL